MIHFFVKYLIKQQALNIEKIERKKTPKLIRNNQEDEFIEHFF